MSKIIRCEHCGDTRTYPHPSKEKLTIRCHLCDRPLYTFYADPNASPHRLHATEARLLRTVPPATRHLYDGLCRFYRQYGYAPTLRELTALMGWGSTNSTRHHLDSLQSAGLIERDYGAARGIRLLYAD